MFIYLQRVLECLYGLSMDIDEYAWRLLHAIQLHLREMVAIKRIGSSNLEQISQPEGHVTWAAIPQNMHMVIMRITTNVWSSEQLTVQMQQWLQNSRSLALVVGGVDKLSQECRNSTQRQRWLSLLALPYVLVRVVLVEQLYRTCSTLHRYPYHRV